MEREDEKREVGNVVGQIKGVHTLSPLEVPFQRDISACHSWTTTLCWGLVGIDTMKAMYKSGLSGDFTFTSMRTGWMGRRRKIEAGMRGIAKPSLVHSWI